MRARALVAALAAALVVAACGGDDATDEPTTTATGTATEATGGGGEDGPGAAGSCGGLDAAAVGGAVDLTVTEIGEGADGACYFGDGTVSVDFIVWPSGAQSRYTIAEEQPTGTLGVEPLDFGVRSFRSTTGGDLYVELEDGTVVEAHAPSDRLASPDALEALVATFLASLG